MQVIIKGKVWTKEDFDNLNRFAELGYSLPKIMAATGRTKNSIIAKMRQIGWHKSGDIFSKDASRCTYARRTYRGDALPIDKRDIVNNNSNPEFGKVHPLMCAKSILQGRLIIDKNNAVFLDGKHITGGLKLNVIMQATNAVLKKAGKRQIDYDKSWLV